MLYEEVLEVLVRAEAESTPPSSSWHTVVGGASQVGCLLSLLHSFWFHANMGLLLHLPRSVPGDQCLEASPWWPVPSGQCLVASPWWPVPGGQSLEASPWWPVPGGQCLVVSAWLSVVEPLLHVHRLEHSLPFFRNRIGQFHGTKSLNSPQFRSPQLSCPLLICPGC